MSSIYLDWAATAPPYADILSEAARIAEADFGNPSSAHAHGRAARAVLESARARLAAALGIDGSRLVFTSGGSESDAMVLLSAVLRKGSASILISDIEHAAVHEEAKVLAELGVTVLRVRPDSDGIVSPAAVVAALRPDTVLVSIMTVNNETGAIQPVADIASAVRAASAGSGRTPLVHTDAVQALGKLDLRPVLGSVDAASFSAHKIGGPRGVGALYLARPLAVLARGGGQENGLRPGTHNTAGAWAFAAAAERSIAGLDEARAGAAALERALLDGVRSIDGAVVIPQSRAAGDGRYSPFIVSLAFPGLGGETLARILDDEGVSVSTGAACSSSKKDRRVLDAMGVDKRLPFSSIRVSTGRGTTLADIEAFLGKARAAYARYRT